MHPQVAQSAFVRRPIPLKGFLGWSAAGHGATLALLFIIQFFSFGPRLDLNQKPIHASLVRLGKPRDQQLLPRKEELPPPPQKTDADKPVPVAVKPPDKPAVPVAIPGVKPQPIKAPKQDGVQESAARRKSLFGAFSKDGKAATAEELEGSPEGDRNGDSATAEGDPYWGLVRVQVQRNYDVSQTIPEQERLHLRAQVVLLIGHNGQLVRVQLAKSSGNGMFDNAVLAAVKRAAPFSPPPDRFRSELQKRGVALEFSP